MNENDPDKIIDFEQKRQDKIIATQHERDVQKQVQKALTQKALSKAEPMFNIPPNIKIMALLLIVPFLALELIAGFIVPDVHAQVFTQFGFIPALWTGDFNPDLLMVLSLVSYNFLHGGWMHLGMNVVMLIAFAAGVEKSLGGRRLWLIFFLSSFGGVVAHTIFNLYSFAPLVGASAGISGLFAALLVIMLRSGMMPSKHGIWPFVALWVGMSVLFGLFTPIDPGASVAWVAHLGGFGTGLALIHMKWFSRPLYR